MMMRLCMNQARDMDGGLRGMASGIVEKKLNAGLVINAICQSSFTDCEACPCKLLKLLHYSLQAWG